MTGIGQPNYETTECAFCTLIYATEERLTGTLRDTATATAEQGEEFQHGYLAGTIDGEKAGYRDGLDRGYVSGVQAARKKIARLLPLLDLDPLQREVIVSELDSLAVSADQTPEEE